MDAPYQYNRHLTSGDTIRLIELFPGASRDPVRSKIIYCRLSEQRQYEALSYTWGSPFDTERLSSAAYACARKQCDLLVESSLLKITLSLHEALRRMRRPDAARLIWIDAVCIDQTHDQEKSWQIQKMRAIYQQAQRVVIWLGPSDSDSEVAVRCLESGYRYHLRTRSYMTLGQIQGDHPPPCNEIESLDQMTAASFGKLFGLSIQSDVVIPQYPIKAVAGLLSRAYWGRGWCWQEFCVAARVTIMCGEETLEDGDMALQVFLGTWDVFKSQLGHQPYGLDHRPWAMMEVRRSFQNIKYLQEGGFVDKDSLVTPGQWMPFKAWAYMNPNMTDEGKAWMYREGLSKLSLKALLEESTFSWLQTSKEHREDQIYALMGIASDAEDSEIAIDCSLHWEHVYTQVAMSYLRKGDLWVLNHCQGCIGGRSVHLPSWVPDWSEGCRGARISQHWSPPEGHLAALQPCQKPAVEFTQPNLIRLKGMLVDEVSWISSERYAFSVNQLATTDHTLLSYWIDSIVMQCRRHRRRDIWTVMIANSRDLPLPKEHKADKTEEDMRMYLDIVFNSILDYSQPTGSFQQQHLLEKARNKKLQVAIRVFLRCFLQATASRCVFKTKGGRLGLASAGICEGDRVGVFLGNETAFVLRPTTTTTPQEPRYRIMCESYVHGLMTDDHLKGNTLIEDITLE